MSVKEILEGDSGCVVVFLAIILLVAIGFMSSCTYDIMKSQPCPCQKCEQEISK